MTRKRKLDLPPTVTVSQRTKRQQKKQKFKSKHQDEEILGHSLKDMADYPRSFRMMLLQKAQLKKKQEVDASVKPSSSAAASSSSSSATQEMKDKQESFKMRAGETYNDYTRRLKNETRKQILEINTESQAKTDRKKRWRAKLKEKEQRKKEKIEADKQQLDFSDLRDNISFGEVVQQPPTLTVKPKLRGNAAAMVAIKAHVQSSANTATTTTTATTTKTQADTIVYETRARHRQRLKSMNPATRRILTTERDRVVATYRAMKEAKLKIKLETMVE
ncbi:hypothetical protein BDF22DRAFT_294371 [Syncephalis plumigaleata]|nr:hypothetical protein BDF22DRAFT_294371 [Syncephalis plumigaleata]